MRILVNGGAGYAGSVAVERLLEAGHDVAVLDSMARGHTGAIPAGAPFCQADLRDPQQVERAVESLRPEAIMHFGAMAVVPESVRDPGIYYAVNSGGTLNLLQAMVRHGIGRIVLSSTAAVYGTPGVALIDESEPLLPISPYGSSKLMAERILQDFGAAHGIEYAIFRYFNIAGATRERGEDHHPETHLIPSAIFAAMGRRDPLTIFGRDYDTPDGTAIRDYIHVVDLVDAHILALEADLAQHRVFNLGAGAGTSVADVIEAVGQVAGRSVPAMDGPRRDGDPPVLVADISRAREALGWEPSHSGLTEIVKSAWQWFERHPHGYGRT
jgi:UDP-glucose 4-epimerase